MMWVMPTSKRRRDRTSWWYPGDPTTGALAIAVMVACVIFVVIAFVATRP